MRPLAVVVVDVDAEHVFEVAAVENQQPVQALRVDGANEPFGDRVRLRRPHRRLDDPDTFAAEDLVEGAAVRAVAIPDQEAVPLSLKSKPRLRACCVTHSPVGFLVQPASQTRRFACAMKKST